VVGSGISYVKPLVSATKASVSVSNISSDMSLFVFRNRHGGRYEYTALEADSSVHERLELERKARERAQNACQHYLRSCPRYTLLHHLNDIGTIRHRTTDSNGLCLAQGVQHERFWTPPGLISCHLRGCIQKFPDWPSGARTANGTALYH
jgi:hypothetical protein